MLMEMKLSANMKSSNVLSYVKMLGELNIVLKDTVSPIVQIHTMKNVNVKDL